MTMRVMPLMLVAALLACASSCAKPDWIEQTLVTVDVTGTWYDDAGSLELKLDQQGSKVTGSIVRRGLGRYRDANENFVRIVHRQAALRPTA
jgi:hypothetical protein